MPYAAVGYTRIRRWAPASARTRRLMAVSAALGAVAGVLVYVIRVITREYYELDVYVIAGAGWAGILLCVAVGLSHGALRGVGTFLVFSVATIAAASVALTIVVNSEIAGFGF